MAVAAEQLGRDTMKGQLRPGHLDFARSSQCHGKMLMRNLLDSIMNAQRRPTREVGLIRIGSRCDEDSRFQCRAPDQPVSPLERSGKPFSGQPSQSHRGGWNAEARELRRFAGGDPVAANQFLVKGAGVHFDSGTGKVVANTINHGLPSLGSPVMLSQIVRQIGNHLFPEHLKCNQPQLLHRSGSEPGWNSSGGFGK